MTVERAGKPASWHGGVAAGAGSLRNDRPDRAGRAGIAGPDTGFGDAKWPRRVDPLAGRLRGLR